MHVHFAAVVVEVDGLSLSILQFHIGAIFHVLVSNIPLDTLIPLLLTNFLLPFELILTFTLIDRGVVSLESFQS